MSHRRLHHATLVAVALTLASATPSRADAQGASASGAKATGVAADLLADASDVGRKMLSLARAIPADKFDWRPAPGVRSVNEVLRHVAADNYLVLSILGHEVDPATGIKGGDGRAAGAYEQRPATREEAIARMERSFAAMNRALSGTTPARMSEKVNLFGQPATVQQAWIFTVTHVHEHLGQLIAYARSNGVVPPWSQ